MKLILVTLLIRLGLSGAAEDHGNSAHCQNCIEPCTVDPKTETYKCKTNVWRNKKENNTTDWDLCSPSEITNHHGYNCTNKCDFYGKDYHWCTDKYYWGYCSAESCTPHHGYSVHCQKCIEPCKQDPRTELYQCKTYPWDNKGQNRVTDWDFCSPSAKHDWRGRNCSSKCDFHGQDVQWCTTSSMDEYENYGYCSGQSCTLEKEELTDYGYSAQCQKCLKPCEKDFETKKYQCKTFLWDNKLTKNFTDWDWCSPSEKENHHGEKCTNECDFHGEIYKWCKDEYQWGYCSAGDSESCTTEQPDPEDYGYSAHCQKCIGPCKKKTGINVYQCKTFLFDNKREYNVTDWDYCSPSEKHDHRGYNCTNVCAFYGKDYQQCAVGAGSGLCSGKFCTSDPPELPDYGYSSYCQRCIGPCQKKRGADRHSCRTKIWRYKDLDGIWSQGFDWCSPNSKVDFKGRRCLDKCAFKGKDYQWCKTDGDEGLCTGKGNVLCDFLGDTYKDQS